MGTSEIVRTAECIACDGVVAACVRTVIAGWLHGVCVSACWFVPPQCDFSLFLICNYSTVAWPGQMVKDVNKSCQKKLQIVAHSCRALWRLRGQVDNSADSVQRAHDCRRRIALFLPRRAMSGTAVFHVRPVYMS